MKKSLIINLNSNDYNDFVRFCEINGYDENKKSVQCFTKGYNLEKYGSLSDPEPQIIEKEVVKEIIIEKPIEKEIIKEIIVEKPIEIIKEVEKLDNNKINKLYKKIIELENQNKILNSKNENFKHENSEIEEIKNTLLERDDEISRLKRKLNECNNRGGVQFLHSSNLKF